MNSALNASAPYCITRHHSHHYLGFAKTQWHLLSKEAPPRVKPLLYLYRVLLTGIQLMETGVIEANLLTLNEKFQLAYVPDLIAQKSLGTEAQVLNTIDLSFHYQEYQKLMQCLEAASQNSNLPEEPSAKSALQDLLIRVRLGPLILA